MLRKICGSSHLALLNDIFIFVERNNFADGNTLCDFQGDLQYILNI